MYIPHELANPLGRAIWQNVSLVMRHMHHNRRTEAMRGEQQDKIWGKSTKLQLIMQIHLMPLLKRHLPAGFVPRIAHNAEPQSPKLTCQKVAFLFPTWIQAITGKFSQNTYEGFKDSSVTHFISSDIWALGSPQKRSKHHKDTRENLLNFKHCCHVYVLVKMPDEKFMKPWDGSPPVFRDTY